ncbi:DUF3164 family protein [Mesonia sp.]|uniref:DUF3164 family protein n=1 Tax=Mesonia sp. TaxID=1960830 RepID=UPI001761F717|nr:DUF3164 family protein [Mesonia sp.]HIB37594.1 DUF3164 family protein [Mesonia sp.]HIO27526.1 DUF3164 family protein [Flavobacteriaceae bacterium]
MQTKPISEMTDAELQAEVKRREEAKQNDRKAYKELVNESLPTLMETLLKLSKVIKDVKLEVFTGVTGLLELKDKAYGIKDEQRSHTFTTEKGDSITLGYRINDGWDDTVGSGIAKVNKFIESLAKDDDSAKLVKTINQLLKKDAKGNLKSNRVIELDKLTQDFNNAEFTDGVEIIKASYKPVASCYFIEATTKNENGKDVSVPLSISSVDFPEDTRLPYFENRPSLC